MTGHPAGARKARLCKFKAMKANCLYGVIGTLCLVLLPLKTVSAEKRAAETGSAPRFAVKTNALYWAAASFNAGFEAGLAPKITLDVSAAYNPWVLSENRKFKFWLAQAEGRYWFGRRFRGHFAGVHVLYADFNVGGIRFLGLGGRRYEGDLYGAGVSYGYRWAIGKRWGVEATAGLGYLRSDYDRYEQKRCGASLGSGHRNYFGPTRIGVSFSFTFD